jgi:hypothetical protein
LRGRVGPLLLVGRNNKTTAAVVEPPSSGCPRRDTPRPSKHRVMGRQHPSTMLCPRRPQWWAVARRHRGGWSGLEHGSQFFQQPATAAHEWGWGKSLPGSVAPVGRWRWCQWVHSRCMAWRWLVVRWGVWCWVLDK